MCLELDKGQVSRGVFGAQTTYCLRFEDTGQDGRNGPLSVIQRCLVRNEQHSARGVIISVVEVGLVE